NPRRAANAVNATPSASTANRPVRSRRPCCRMMPSSRAMLMSWSRMWCCVATTCCSIRPNGTRPRRGGPICPTCPQATIAPLAPHSKALRSLLAHDIKISQPQILPLFRQAGSDLAAGTLSGWLTQEVAIFHAEKDALYQAGLLSSPFQQIDDTATRVNGQNQHCHIVCNPLYTVYHTCPGKDRLSVLDVLRNGRERVFVLNAEALEILEQIGLSGVQWTRLAKLAGDQPLSEAALHTLLETHLPNLGCQQRKWVMDASAIAAYHAATDWPIVQLLLGDDAPQWTWLTEELALCWVHEGRHYTKLEPLVAHHRQLLKRFRARFWRYYHALRRYKEAPSA